MNNLLFQMNKLSCIKELFLKNFLKKKTLFIISFYSTFNLNKSKTNK